MDCLQEEKNYSEDDLMGLGLPYFNGYGVYLISQMSKITDKMKPGFWVRGATLSRLSPKNHQILDLIY
jgi:hypothetical protein